MSVAPQLLDPSEPSPLASARLQRKLTVEEAARRSGLTPEQIEWLEAGRVYRFPNADDALVAVVLYASGLGIDHDEARALARLPVFATPQRRPTGKLIGAAAGALVAIALLITLVTALGGPSRNHRPAVQLLPPYKLTVDVLNGGGDINYTRSVASKIGGFGYKITRVAKANRFDYRETVVYFEPGGEEYAKRLAEQLCVEARPLPGGDNPRRLVVIAGPPSVGC